MKFRFSLGAALALLSTLTFLGSSASAQAPKNITMTVGVCDPAYGTRCAKPDVSGNLPVTLSGTVPIPTGAATAAKQDTGNTSLGSIDTKLSSQATAAKQDTGNTSLATIAAAVAAATPAGENHVGEVGGNQITVQIAQTVTASSAYTSGNAVGGLMTVTNAARVSAGSGLLQSVAVNAKSAQSTQIDIFIFSANPTTTTCTDKTAFVLASADFDKVLGVVHVTDWTAGNVASLGQAQTLAMPFALSSGTSLFACAVTRSTPTYTATTDISIGFRLIRN